jgi:hypothetical protein
MCPTDAFSTYPELTGDCMTPSLHSNSNIGIKSFHQMKDRILKGIKAHQDLLVRKNGMTVIHNFPSSPTIQSRGVIQPNQSMKIFKANQRFSIYIDSKHVESHAHEVSKIIVLSL